MRGRILIVSTLGLALLALAPGLALAHGEKGVTVKPLTARADQIVTVNGELLGPDSEVEVRIIGSGMDERLGEAQASEEGDFTKEFRLPPDLEPGSYQIRATGKESATTQITVTGGPAGTGKGEEPGAMAEEPQIERRPLGQAILLVGFFGVLAAAGLFSARMATRHKGAQPR
jgi:hypothetical protein